MSLIPSGQIYGGAGFGTDQTWTPRIVLDQQAGRIYLETGALLSAAKSRDPLNVGYEAVLLNGLLLGRRTSDSLLAPSIIGVLSGAYSHTDSFATLMVVSVAVAT